MIRKGGYCEENLKKYRFFKYIQEKLSKLSHFTQIMLFVGLYELVEHVFVGL